MGKTKGLSVGQTDVSITLPQNVENLLLPDPSLLMFYKNLEDRVLWLDAEVDNVFLEYGKLILRWNMEDAGIPIEERVPIRLLMFSPGGSLGINNAMIDIIKLSKTPVWGINVGEAASAGCFIFLACHKRFAFPKSVFLIHKGSGDFTGTYDEVVAQVVEYQRQIEELAAYIIGHTNISQEDFDENFGTEWYLTAEQALEYGMIDEIITDIDTIFPIGSTQKDGENT